MPLEYTLISIFGKKNSRIKKIMTAFSILEKIFPKIKSLGHALTGSYIYIYRYI